MISSLMDKDKNLKILARRLLSISLPSPVPALKKSRPFIVSSIHPHSQFHSPSPFLIRGILGWGFKEPLGV